jgi:hypothetical protein
MPAFAKCMEATLAVWLGNPWGHSWAAAVHADRVLDALRPAQWEYYINECLPRDKIILDKLTSESKPTIRWRELLGKYVPEDLKPKDEIISKLLKASRGKTPTARQDVQNLAGGLRKKFAP